MIHVITAVHNRYAITEKFVKNLLAQSYKDIHLILVDDGCTDGTADMVLSLMSKTDIIKGDGNLWWGGALHKAFLWVKENLADKKEDFVMFANDDTEFAPDYIEKAVNALKDRPETLLAGWGISRNTGKQIDGAVNFDFATLKTDISGNEYGNCASTRSLFFKVKDFLKIGGFHPILLPHYGSDYEWTIRAVRKYGYTVFCDKNISYLADETTTGDNSYETLTGKKFFAKRSACNPFYRISFIFLATPVKYIFVSVFNQLKRYLKKIGLFFKVLKRN